MPSVIVDCCPEKDYGLVGQKGQETNAWEEECCSMLLLVGKPGQKSVPKCGSGIFSQHLPSPCILLRWHPYAFLSFPWTLLHISSLNLLFKGFNFGQNSHILD